MEGPADGTVAPGLNEVQASLALHDPRLTPAQITARLCESVAALKLGRDAVCCPKDPGGSGSADGSGLAAGSARSRSSPDRVTVPVGAPGSEDAFLSFRPAGAAAIERVRALAAHAGIALVSRRRLSELEQRERVVRRVAEQLQDSLLPPLDEVASTSMAVRYRAAAREARVGGDFYDVFTVPDGRVLIVVGDVVGKGVEAAVRTSRITQTLRALALAGLGLERLLQHCDEQVTYQDPEIMATVWCGVYEPHTGELEFASLGHPPALLLRGGDAAPLRLEMQGLPLGMRDLVDEVPDIRRRLLESGDLLVLYTDGVVEGEGDFIEGQQALLDAVDRRRSETLDDLVDEVLDELVAGANKLDDALLLLVRRR